MGKTVTKQDFFGSTPPSLLDPRAYSPEDLGHPLGSQHLSCALSLPPPRPLTRPQPLPALALASPVTADVKGPQAAALTAAAPGVPGRTVPPPVLCRLLVASCIPSAPDLRQQPLPEDSAGVLAQGSLSDQCWPSCRFWSSGSPLSPCQHRPLQEWGLCLEYFYYRVLSYPPQPWTPQPKSRPRSKTPLAVESAANDGQPGRRALLVQSISKQQTNSSSCSCEFTPCPGPAAHTSLVTFRGGRQGGSDTLASVRKLLGVSSLPQ